MTAIVCFLISCIVFYIVLSLYFRLSYKWFKHITRLTDDCCCRCKFNEGHSVAVSFAYVILISLEISREWITRTNSKWRILSTLSRVGRPQLNTAMIFRPTVKYSYSLFTKGDLLQLFWWRRVALIGPFFSVGQGFAAVGHAWNLNWSVYWMRCCGTDHVTLGELGECLSVHFSARLRTDAMYMYSVTSMQHKGARKIYDRKLHDVRAEWYS